MSAKQIIITRNSQGYFTTTDNTSCVIVSLLNLLGSKHNVPVNMMQRIVNKWGQLLEEDSTMSFRGEYIIPETIDKITDGAYIGRIVSPNVTSFLINNSTDPKYGLDQEFNLSMLPVLFGYAHASSNEGHVIALMKYDRTSGFYVIDNGRPQEVKKLPDGIVYKVEQVRQVIPKQTTYVSPDLLRIREMLKTGR